MRAYAIAVLALTAFAAIVVLYGGHFGPSCYQHPRLPHQAPQPPLVRRLPHSIIIGARKCGTRALIDFLDAHPAVVAAKGEVHYFDSPNRLRLGIDWYRGQMPATSPDQITIEKTPAYFVTESAPRLAKRQMSPDLRLLLIVRDPVTRVVSDYAQHLHRRAKAGRPARKLESLVLTAGSKRVNPRAKMIRTSVYHRHLRRWLGQFPARSIHIVDGDKLIAEPHAELQLVEQFLGLPSYLKRDRFAFNATKGFYCVKMAQPAKAGKDGEGQQRCLGSEKGRRHPPVSPVTVAKLRRFFEAHENRLAELTGRRFSWMKRPPSDDDNSSWA